MSVKPIAYSFIGYTYSSQSNLQVYGGLQVGFEVSPSCLRLAAGFPYCSVRGRIHRSFGGHKVPTIW